jgi:hypothetical protein
MTQPETKTVLGRVFTWDSTGPAAWRCSLSHGRELRLYEPRKTDGVVEGAFAVNGTVIARHWANVAIWGGDQHEADKAAILALQSTLRKMAELEVAGG